LRIVDCGVSIANLPAGEYLLKLDASLDRHAAGRAMRFVIE